jgi:hypothetical protein
MCECKLLQNVTEMKRAVHFVKLCELTAITIAVTQRAR